jgi:hypothetical protein
MVDYIHLVKQDGMTLGLYKNLLRCSNSVIKLFPVVEAGSLVVRGERWHTLPTHAFRKLNAMGFTQTTGTYDNREDRLAIFGGEFQADKVLKKLTKVPLLRDPVQEQFDMHSVAMDRGITYNIFKGDVDTTPDGFDGLGARFAKSRFPSRMQITGSAAPYCVLADEAHARGWFDYLDTAIKYVGLSGQGTSMGGNASRGAIFTNENGYLGMQKAAKMANYTVYSKDILGWNYDTYKGLPIVDIGLQRDQATEIITDAGEYATGTYVYVVRFTEADNDIESPGSNGLCLIQCGNMEVLGPEDHNLYDLYDMQWPVGLAHVGDDYCVAQIRSIKFAAS